MERGLVKSTMVGTNPCCWSHFSQPLREKTVLHLPHLGGRPEEAASLIFNIQPRLFAGCTFSHWCVSVRREQKHGHDAKQRSLRSDSWESMANGKMSGGCAGVENSQRLEPPLTSRPLVHGLRCAENVKQMCECRALGLLGWLWSRIVYGFAKRGRTKSWHPLAPQPPSNIGD